MIQTYQGYFGEDGRFIPDIAVKKIPAGRRAIVNILDDEVIVLRHNSENQNKLDEIKKILTKAAKAENELTDAEWREFTNLRAQSNAGLARKIEL